MTYEQMAVEYAEKYGIIEYEVTDKERNITRGTAIRFIAVSYISIV